MVVTRNGEKEEEEGDGKEEGAENVFGKRRSGEDEDKESWTSRSAIFYVCAVCSLLHDRTGCGPGCHSQPRHSRPYHDNESRSEMN